MERAPQFCQSGTRRPSLYLSGLNHSLHHTLLPHRRPGLEVRSPVCAPSLEHLPAHLLLGLTQGLGLAGLSLEFSTWLDLWLLGFPLCEGTVKGRERPI